MIAQRTATLTLSYEDDGTMPTSTELDNDPIRGAARVSAWIAALAAGSKVGSLSLLTGDGDAVAASGAFLCSGTSHGVAASGSYALSGVGGTAATGSYALTDVGGDTATQLFTYSSASGTTTATIRGVAFQQTMGTDAERGTELASQINASVDPLIAGIITANDSGDGQVEIETDARGAAGNAYTTTVTGTGLTVDGATMEGGLDGAVTVVINGTSVGPVNTTNLSDTDAATAVAAAIELNGTLGPLLVAVGSTTNVSLTWGAKGTAGNAITLAAGVSTTGTATRSGATFSGGAQGSVGLTINGTLVTTDTTNLTDTAAATACAAAIEANGTLGPLVVAVGSTTNVSITWGVQGTVGNAVTLAAGTSATGTATRSGATLSGGTDTSVTATINGVAIPVNTTTTTTDAQVATAVRAAVNASVDPLVAGVVTAGGSSTTATITADTPGAAGNTITIAATGTGFTASGARLEDGEDATNAATLER